MARVFDPSYIFTVLPQLLLCLPVTLGIIAGTVLLGGLLGTLLAVLLIRKNPVGRAVAHIYIYIVRCVPTVVMLFLVFYGLPQIMLQVFGVDINVWNNVTFVLIAMSLLFAASMAEVVRSAYLSVDHGQMEAALSVGLSEVQAVWRIMLPQAVAVALPNFTNSVVALMKESAIAAYTIGVIDVMGQGKMIISYNYGGHNLEVYIAVGLVYWAMTFLFQWGFGALEHRLSRGRQAIRADGATT